MKTTRELWNQTVRSIPQDKSYSQYALEKEKLFPTQAVVCDLAGSIGADALYFLEHGHKVTLLDVSDEALKIAQQKAQGKNLHLTIKQVDLGDENIPMENESMDIMYSRLGIHYFEQERTEVILGEIYRILKKGGGAFLTVKSPSDKAEMDFLLKTAKEIKPGVYNDNGQIKSRFTLQQWENMLQKVGIQTYNVHEYKENLAGIGYQTKSGNEVLLLNEIMLQK